MLKDQRVLKGEGEELLVTATLSSKNPGGGKRWTRAPKRLGHTRGFRPISGSLSENDFYAKLMRELIKFNSQIR